MLLTLADLKAIVGIGASDDTRDAQLTLIGDSITEAIQGYCERVFEVPESASPITRDATARDILDIPDTLSLTGLTAFGAALTAGTDYVLLTKHPLAPYSLSTLYPHYSRIRRVSGGQAVGWDTGSDGGTDWLGAITYDAIEAYAATVPARVTLAAQIMAAQMYERRIAVYSGDAASTAAGTNAANALIVGFVADLLFDFKDQP